MVPFQNCVRQRRPYPRWPPLLKIEFFSNAQNGSILRVVSEEKIFFKFHPPFF
jgi:hypothetical protein